MILLILTILLSLHKIQHICLVIRFKIFGNHLISLSLRTEICKLSRALDVKNRLKYPRVSRGSKVIMLRYSALLSWLTMKTRTCSPSSPRWPRWWPQSTSQTLPGVSSTTRSRYHSSIQPSPTSCSFNKNNFDTFVLFFGTKQCK